MIDILNLISNEMTLNPVYVNNAIEMKLEGATLPFIARYRKEKTGEMNEIILRELFDKYEYYTELEERKTTVLKTISEQGKLTDELKEKIENCLDKTELEDLYLPYKPKKRTRATIAREKGLEPLSILIKENNDPKINKVNLDELAFPFINAESGVTSTEEALAGASDILAEEVSENAEFRAYIRNHLVEEGIFISSIKEEVEVGSTKYEMYRNFKVPVKNIQPHNLLALRRGESEGIISYQIEYNEEKILGHIEENMILTKVSELVSFYRTMIADAFERLMKNSLMAEVRLDRKYIADLESIKTFAENVRNLLLASPAGMQSSIGIDPGFRTGCKLAVIDETGKFLEYKTVFPFQSERQKLDARETLMGMIAKYKTKLIAIGNGTASRETDLFVTEIIGTLESKPIKVVVSEAGASVYSASEVAGEEFPDLDLTVRGAISIGRRLQDPLAELVKIDPKAIGVGQYQHDVDQKLLKKKLEETVESCVNFVGVDLNLASKELLSYVSGINSGIAKNIITYRNENGAFIDRKQLLKIPKLGQKAFEQSAGFLRIRNGSNPLDNSAVHPESYSIAEKILEDLKISIDDIKNNLEKIEKLDLNKYVTKEFGLPTIKDIVNELKKPGRDPREAFQYASFMEGISEISDLKIGMELEGYVTNVTNFGAFIDIGVHQDGFVHKSEVANRFVEDPKTVLKVGQVVKVRVIDINEKLKRVALSMKSGDAKKLKEKFIKEEKSNYTLNDLVNKFKKN